jgi:hypothetical protein
MAILPGDTSLVHEYTPQFAGEPGVWAKWGISAAAGKSLKKSESAVEIGRRAESVSQ